LFTIQGADDGYFKDPDTYTLYITASAMDESIPVFHRTSPAAVLDRFIGDKSRVDAPEWVEWDKAELEFQQPRSCIADVFARLAVSDHNLLEVCISHSTLILYGIALI